MNRIKEALSIEDEKDDKFVEILACVKEAAFILKESIQKIDGLSLPKLFFVRTSVVPSRGAAKQMVVVELVNHSDKICIDLFSVSFNSLGAGDCEFYSNDGQFHRFKTKEELIGLIVKDIDRSLRIKIKLISKCYAYEPSSAAKYSWSNL